MIRDETLDRFGALPDPVQVLFAIGSLRLTAQRLGVEEITTYREQVRLKPVTLSEVVELGLSAVIPGATFARGDAHAQPDARACLRCGPGPVGRGAAASGGRRAEPSRASALADPHRCPPRRLVRCIPLAVVCCPSSWSVRPRRRARPRVRTRPRDPPPPPPSPDPIIDATSSPAPRECSRRRRPAAAALRANRRRHRHAGGGVQPVLARRDDPVPAGRHVRERSRRHRRRREGARRRSTPSRRTSAPTRLPGSSRRTA